AYYTYIINRWAAFPNVHWEVGNEISNFNRETYRGFSERMVRFFRERDPYGRLVVADEQGDVISFHALHQTDADVPPLRPPPPAADRRGAARTFTRRLAKTGQPWYPAGNAQGVDVAFYQRTLELVQRHGKFVQNDELMLRGRHYQRIGMWASFMAGGSATSMDHPKYEIHVDPEVMADHRHLRRIVDGLDLVRMVPRPEVPAAFDRERLRAYCLGSNDQYVLYFHHFADHARPCVDETVALMLPAGRYTVRHYDPKSGRFLAEVQREVELDCATGKPPSSEEVALPEFSIDHVLVVERV
ncbi:MAG: hypothetical protein HY332_22235, partial [Chloroflexi bacterium]|nr:hypothetical protein [Chloroflexota bacterium]